MRIFSPLIIPPSRRKMEFKRVNSLLCLFLLIGMDGAKTSASPGVYTLPDLVDDLRIVAGVVTGVAVAQNIRNGSLNEDELVGEMCLGPYQKMSSLAAVNASGLAMDLETIGRIVTEECGDKCDREADRIIESGNKVLDVFDRMLTEDQKSILRDTDTFKNVTTLLDRIENVVDAKISCSGTKYLLRKLDLSNEDSIIAFLSEFKYNMAETMELEPSIDYVDKHMDVLNRTGLDDLAKKLDILLSLESIHGRILEEMKLFRTVVSELNEFAKRTASLEGVLTTETVDRIDKTLKRMLPIVTSSGRSSKHPFRLLVSHFNSTIEDFEKKFLKNANSLPLKPFLEPVESLIEDVEPLLKSWESVKFDERIDEKIESVRMNLNVSLSQIASFSAFLSPLQQCVEDVVLEPPAYEFKYMMELRNKVAILKGEDDDGRVRAHFDTFRTAFEGLHTTRKLMEFIDRNKTEIRKDLKNIPNMTAVKEEVENYETKIRMFTSSPLVSQLYWDRTLKKVFSNLQLTPLVNALDCLKKDNVLSKPWDPTRMQSLDSIKSESADLKAVISAAKALEEPIGEWRKSEQAATESKSRRSADESTTPRISDEMTRKFASGTKVISDFAEVYEARDHLVTLSSLAETVNREVGALNDAEVEKRIAKVWNSEVQRMLADLPEAVQVLNGTLSKVPRSLVDFSTAFAFAQLPDFANIDTRALRKALRFVRNPDVEKSLKAIGSLDLEFVDSFRRLEGAREALTHILIFLRTSRKSVGTRGKRDASRMLYFKSGAIETRKHLALFSFPNCIGDRLFHSESDYESTDEDCSDSERGPDVPAEKVNKVNVEEKEQARAELKVYSDAMRLHRKLLRPSRDMTIK